MIRKEFEKLKNIEEKLNINVSDLNNQNDRTLIYGYDIERNDFHLYLKNGYFYLIQGNEEDYIFIRNLKDICKYSCIPNKRIYPEFCDYEFCLILKELGIKIPFTNYKENKKEEKFYGLILEELK
jgi:hypothetical protein